MREKRNIKIVLVTGVPRKFTVFPRQFLAPLKLNIRLCFAEKSVRYRKSIHQFLSQSYAQSAFTCSKLTTETLEEGMKYV